MKNMNRRNTTLSALAALAALALVSPAFAQAPAGPNITPLTGEERARAIAQANSTLNGVSRLQGRFTQVSPNGRATGQFYLQRPGKLRFEYDPPQAMLIISDGSVVAMRDTSLRTTERTPLRSTPLNLVLRAQVNLERDARVTRVSRSGDWLLVTARDRGGRADGEIQLNFQGPNAELRSWYITDAAGVRTQIELTNVTAPGSIDARLFRMPDRVESRPGRG